MTHLLAVLLFAASATSASAQSYSVTVDWDPVTTSTDGAILANLAGYRLFQSTNTLLGRTTAEAMADVLVTKVEAPASTTSFTATGLLPGATYQFRLTAYDARAAQSDFNIDGGTLLDVEISTSFTLPDSAPPQVAITTPGSGAFVSGSVTLTASAADSCGIASVRFMLDGSPLGPLLTVAPYTYTWDTVGQLAGVHSLSAVAIDANGNHGTATAVSVTISRTNVLLTLSPTVSGSANLAVESTDPNFPAAASFAAAVSMPSGVKNVTLTRVTASVPTFSATISASSFTAADFNALDGTTQTVVIGTQTIVAYGAGHTVTPPLGGRINDPAGSLSRVVVNANGVGLDAQILIQALAPDLTGKRAAAADRQNLKILGAGQDFVYNSSGALNSATITLPYDATLIPPIFTTSRVRIAYFNAATGAWELASNTSLGAGVVSARVTHFSPYVPVLAMFDATVFLRDAYAYPNPATGSQTPIIRVMAGVVDSVDITIYDVAGRKIHSGSVSGAPTGIYNGEYYYDYPWTASKASGVYFAVVHAHASDGSTVKGRVKLAVVK